MRLRRGCSGAWIALLAAAADRATKALALRACGDGGPLGCSARPLVTGVLNTAFGNAGSQADPMFAEPAVNVTRPPQLAEEQSGETLQGDPSDSWVYEEESPVDKTAAELAAEALGN